MAGQFAEGGGPRRQPRTGTRQTLLFSMGGSRESLTRRRRILALLNDRAEAVTHRMMTLDPSSTLWGTSIREIREAYSHYTEWGLKSGIPSNVTARPRKAPLRCEPP